MNLTDKLNRIGYPPVYGERIVAIMPSELKDTLEQIDNLKEFRAAMRVWIGELKDAGEWYPHP